MLRDIALVLTVGFEVIGLIGRVLVASNLVASMGSSFFFEGFLSLNWVVAGILGAAVWWMVVVGLDLGGSGTNKGFVFVPLALSKLITTSTLFPGQ